MCGFFPINVALLDKMFVLQAFNATVALASLGLCALMIIRRMQGNPGHEPGVRAAMYRAVFDRDPEEELASAEEPVGH